MKSRALLFGLRSSIVLSLKNLSLDKNEWFTECYLHASDLQDKPDPLSHLFCPRTANLNWKWLSDHLVYRSLNSWIFDATNLVNFGKSSDLVLPQFSVCQPTNLYDCLTSVFCTKQPVFWWFPLFFWCNMHWMPSKTCWCIQGLHEARNHRIMFQCLREFNAESATLSFK